MGLLQHAVCEAATLQQMGSGDSRQLVKPWRICRACSIGWTCEVSLRQWLYPLSLPPPGAAICCHGFNEREERQEAADQSRHKEWLVQGEQCRSMAKRTVYGSSARAAVGAADVPWAAACAHGQGRAHAWAHQRLCRPC